MPEAHLHRYFLLLTIFVYSVICGNVTDSNTDTYVSQRDKFLPNSVLESKLLPRRSRYVDCAGECQKNAECKSFNLRSGNTVCELNSAADFTTNGSSLVAETGSQYYAKLPHDCSDHVGEYGAHWIYVPTLQKLIRVFCEDGWTVLMRRTGPALDFNRPWADYRNGFGVIEGDHWLGLEAFHHLTNQGNYSVMTEVRDLATNTYFSDIHVDFRVGSEDEDYILHGFPAGIGNLSESYSPDQWNVNYDMKFTTYDRDRDLYSANCAVDFGGGWWYNACSLVSLTATMWTEGVCTTNCHKKFKHNGVPLGANGDHEILLASAILKIKTNV